MGLVLGVVASAAFLIVAFRYWESIITPYPLQVTQTRKSVIFLVEIGIYCAAGSVFGIVNSLFATKEMARFASHCGGKFGFHYHATIHAY